MKKSTLILIISTAIFFTSTIYLLFLNFQKPNEPLVETQLSTLVPIKTIDLTANWKTYENKEYGFEFKYPTNLDVLPGGGPVDLFLTIGNISVSVLKNDSTLYLVKNQFASCSRHGVETNDGSSLKLEVTTGKSSCFATPEYLYIISTPEESSTYSTILSTFKFTDQKEEAALDVAKKYLDAYVSQDWITAKQLNKDPEFDERIAQSYGFTKYTITGHKIDANPNYYHVYITFTDKDGKTHSQAPNSSGPLEVYLTKTKTGEWKALTWYFYP